MAAEVDTEALARLHLAQLHEASTTGKLTLPNGKVILPSDDAWDSLINLAKWGVQTLKAKKPKFLADTGDLGLKATRKAPDGKA
jgi:hypothetical protein